MMNAVNYAAMEIADEEMADVVGGLGGFHKGLDKNGNVRRYWFKSNAIKSVNDKNLLAAYHKADSNMEKVMDPKNTQKQYAKAAAKHNSYLMKVRKVINKNVNNKNYNKLNKQSKDIAQFFTNTKPNSVEM